MTDVITPEERRLIDEAVAAGRVYKARTGEYSQDAAVSGQRWRPASKRGRIAQMVGGAEGNRKRLVKARGGLLNV